MLHINHSLTLQSVTFGTLAVNKQNCMRLAKERCSRSYFSLFMSMTRLGLHVVNNACYMLRNSACPVTMRK